MIRRNFEIQTDHLISARRESLATANNRKENLPKNGHCRKSKREQRERLIRRSCWRTEKTMEYENDGDSSCYWRTR